MPSPSRYGHDTAVISLYDRLLILSPRYYALPSCRLAFSPMITADFLPPPLFRLPIPLPLAYAAISPLFRRGYFASCDAATALITPHAGFRHAAMPIR